MSESTMRTVQPTRGSHRVTAAIIAAILAIFALCLVLADTSDAPEGEAFGGTDSVVTTQLEEKGVEPWFTPLFEPNSGEVESGLFALQAGIGAGILGYALGNLNGRRAARREDAERNRLGEDAERNRLGEDAERNRLGEDAERNRLGEDAATTDQTSVPKG